MGRVVVLVAADGWGGVGGAVEVLDGVGEDVEVVRGLGGGIGAEDGAAAGGEVEGDGAADAFCCAAVRGLEGMVSGIMRWKRLRTEQLRDVKDQKKYERFSKYKTQNKA